MVRKIIIRPAIALEQAEIAQLGTTPDAEPQLVQSILNRCMLVAKSRRRLIGSAGIDLDRKEIIQFRVRNEVPSMETAKRLLNAIERLAVQYGIFELSIAATDSTTRLLKACGYRKEPASTQPGSQVMKRTFTRRQTRYSRRIFSLLDHLGIGRDYATTHQIPLQPEATRLTSIGLDVFEREQRKLPAAAAAWQSMQGAAAAERIEIQAVSAWRSVDYQAGIVQRKLDQGQSMKNILWVSAAPGFSEHHTGRAIDVTTPGFEVLEEVFEHSPAFEWLTHNACDFGFYLSFPRDNRHGVAFEPWHWAWNSGLVQ